MKIYQVDRVADKATLCNILEDMGGFSEKAFINILSSVDKPVFVYVGNDVVIRVDTDSSLSEIENYIKIYSYPDTSIIPFDETIFREDIKWTERDSENAKRIEEMLCNEVRAWSRDWSNYDKLDRKINKPISVTELAKKLGEKYLLTIKPTK